ncbi:uncharacterized protein [Spinacia oleracea]|uniref:Pistil-specific extensin-like protein n=1 Tax=Spinacia oleracea TaxID=3562 RepID=A0A9R0JBC6_SPIOL|nr:uncharacterized protein LOC110803670 [Spinacia oleracea]
MEARVLMMMMIILGCSLKLTEATMDEAEVFHVSGFVKCQDCSQGWNEWVQGDKPIKGARVSITCLDDCDGLAHYGSDATDDDGEFSLIVKKIVHGKKLNLKDCLVRLVSSPDSSCNILTDFGKGKTGVNLRQPSVIYRGVTKYVVGPFYYTTPTCDCDDEPDNNHKTYQGSS